MVDERFPTVSLIPVLLYLGITLKVFYFYSKKGLLLFAGLSGEARACLAELSVTQEFADELQDFH